MNLRQHRAGQFGGHEAVLARRGRTRQLCIGCQGQERGEEEASEHVHFQQDRPEARFLRLVRRCWGPRNWIHPDGLCRYNHQRFEDEVPSTAVVNMSGISGSTSVSRSGAVQADPSQLTLRVEALSLGNFSTKLVSLASITSTFHEEVQINGTHTVNLCTNSDVGSGTGACMDSTQTAALVVVLAPELQQDQTVYVLIDAGSVLDSSGNSLADLVNSDSNFAVAEKVIVPNGTVTFRVCEVSTKTTIVISFTVSVPLAGKILVRLVRRLRD